MLFNEVIYQIYPLGFCGAPSANDGKTVSRIRRVIDWIPYLRKLGITAVLFNPVFESDRHGYDVRDYSRIDCRLGTNDDFADVCDSLHEAGIKVILDASYNHVGRGFFGFQDVLKNREQSKYTDWFFLDFTQNGRDGFTYADWEGHGELVKLNLQNETVIRYLLGRTDQWIGEFGIDGLRLDVAYMLDKDFIRRLSTHIHAHTPDFLLIGEHTGAGYHELLGENMLNCVTNYELRGELIRSFNDRNMHILSDLLDRQFGRGHGEYEYCQLLNFADNHDINRIASELGSSGKLTALYALLFSIPGIPCLYYGSEWGEKGKRRPFSDKPLRPSFTRPKHNSLSTLITTLCEIHRTYSVFYSGDFNIITRQDRQLIFRRRSQRGQLTFALNADKSPAVIHADFEVGQGMDLITKKKITFSGEITLEPESVYLWYTDWL